jgi:hypothetical protein
MSLVIDVHTHMLSKEWLALLKQHGGPRYSVGAGRQDRRQQRAANLQPGLAARAGPPVARQ